MARRAAPILALALVVAACGGDAPQARRPPVAVRAQNMLLPGGASDAIRVGFAPAEPSAQVIVTFRPDTAPLVVCPLPDVAAPLPDAGCRREIRSGVREPITGPGMRALAIVHDGEGAIGLDLYLEYGGAGRDLEVRLPLIAAPVGDCRDNACNPFLEMTPTRNGRLRARARWRGPDATLVLLQGRVLARSLTGTGVPYREPARAVGRSPLELAADLSEGDEYALALVGTGDLTEVEIRATWP